mmetsp:Transcript_17667/g.55340  ORF Transcript_17667/g.55340 Transcript_17667/m.55340 type:complete len:246 (-) Transcript_17667:263-1000(-)
MRCPWRPHGSVCSRRGTRALCSGRRRLLHPRGPRPRANGCTGQAVEGPGTLLGSALRRHRLGLRGSPHVRGGGEGPELRLLHRVRRGVRILLLLQGIYLHRERELAPRHHQLAAASRRPHGGHARRTRCRAAACGAGHGSSHVCVGCRGLRRRQGQREPSSLQTGRCGCAWRRRGPERRPRWRQAAACRGKRGPPAQGPSSSRGSVGADRVPGARGRLQPGPECVRRLAPLQGRGRERRGGSELQ